MKFIYDEEVELPKEFYDSFDKNVRAKMNVRQRGIYKDGCKATRFEWCNANGDYISIKTMATPYLRNVVQLLREVAEAKIEDSKKVLTHFFLVNEHDRFISKMSVDDYCSNHFICWPQIKSTLDWKDGWIPNTTQFSGTKQQSLSYDNEILGSGTCARIDDIGLKNKELTKTEKDIVDLHSEVYSLKGETKEINRKLDVRVKDIIDLSSRVYGLNQTLQIASSDATIARNDINEVKTRVSQDRSSNIKSYVETYTKIEKLTQIVGGALAAVNNLDKRLTEFTDCIGAELSRQTKRKTARKKR